MSIWKFKKKFDMIKIKIPIVIQNDKILISKLKMKQLVIHSISSLTENRKWIL